MPLTLSGATGLAGLDGSASTPVVQGTDTNTGVFYPAADTVGLSTNGSERMRVDSAGNVGIGTTSPNALYKLTLSGVSGSNGMTIYNSGDANRGGAFVATGASNSGTFAVNTTASGYALTFGVDSTEKMRIDTAGNVGIGTNSPGYKLEVKGASGAQGYLSIHDGTGDTTVSGNNAASLLFQARDTSIRTIAEIDAVNTTTNGTGGAMVFQTRVSDTLAERMRIDSLGNVGIGTTSAIATFDVNGEIRTASSANWNYAALNVVRKSSNTSTPRMISMALGGDDSASTTIGAYNAIWGIYNASPSASSTSSALQGEMAYAAYYGHRWYNNGTERMRIDSSGQLWVGYSSQIFTASAYRLGISFDGSSSQGIVIKNTVNSASGGAIRFVDYLGNFSGGGIFYTSSNAITYATSSDYRLKENVKPLTKGLETISALKPVSYDWKNDGLKGEGFLAHELQSVVPAAVVGEKDAVDGDGNIMAQGVDYSKIVVHLVAAIQELTAKVTALEAKVGA